MPTSNHESASTTHRNNIFAYLFGRLLYLFVGHRLAWSVLAISNGIAIAFWYISITERSHAVHVRFVRESQEVQWAIESRLFRYRVAVRATTAFFESVDSVSGAQWKSFTSLLNVQELLPELEALGFAPRVPHEALTSYMDGVRATTHARYNVFPTNRDDVAFPVLFVEPLTLENRNIIGFDMSSTPLRRKAMVEARVTGLPAATPGTSLFEDIGKPNVGFSLFGPVYSRQSRIRLPSTSSDSLIGYTFASFRFNELMRGVLLEPGTRGVHFAIFDAGDRGICLYDSDTAMLSDSDETRPELASDFRLEFGGQIWLVRTAAGPTFAQASGITVPTIFLLCAVFAIRNTSTDIGSGSLDMTSVRTCVQNTLRQMGDECLTIASNCLVVAAVVNNVEHIDVLADRIHTTLDERFRFGAQFEISGFLLEDVEVTTSRLLEMAPDELPAELALVN